MDFPGGSVLRNLPANSGDASLIPGSGRWPGKGNGNLLQCSCLGNPKDRGACRAIVHRVTKDLDMTERLNSNKRLAPHLLCLSLQPRLLTQCLMWTVLRKGAWAKHSRQKASSTHPESYPSHHHVA